MFRKFRFHVDITLVVVAEQILVCGIRRQSYRAYHRPLVLSSGYHWLRVITKSYSTRSSAQQLSFLRNRIDIVHFELKMNSSNALDLHSTLRESIYLGI